MTRLLVTGDRDWQNRVIIYTVLYNLVEKINADGDEVIITEGDADGADKIAGWAAKDLQAHFRVHHDPHPAKWYRHDPKKNRDYFFKGAGPERNDEMLNLKDPPPQLVLAFHNKLEESKGTRHCVLGAIRRNYDVQLFAENGTPNSYATSFIAGGKEGRPEEILQRAIEALYPLTW